MKDEISLRPASASRTTPKILLFEQDPGLRKSIVLTLQPRGIKVREALDNAAVRYNLEHEPPDVFLLDFESSVGHSGEWIDLFREKNANGKGFVVLTTIKRVADGWRKQYQPDVVLYKPFDVRFLCHRIEEIV